LAPGGALDFDGRNIFAAADDDVLLAIDDVDVILVVPDRHVAVCSQPLVMTSAVARGSMKWQPSMTLSPRMTISPMDSISRARVHVEIDHTQLAAGHRQPVMARRRERPASSAKAIVDLSRAGGDGGGFQ
jgi:hypothetical protein